MNRSPRPTRSLLAPLRALAALALVLAVAPVAAAFQPGTYSAVTEGGDVTVTIAVSLPDANGAQTISITGGAVGDDAITTASGTGAVQRDEKAIGFEATVTTASGETYEVLLNACDTDLASEARDLVGGIKTPGSRTYRFLWS